MTATTFTAPGPGPVVFGLDAPAAYAEITVSPDAATASAVLSGPGRGGQRRAGSRQRPPVGAGPPPYPGR